MFTFPRFVSIPILNTLGSGTADWPTFGVVVAWMLVAALIGSLLGILRERAPKKPLPVRQADVEGKVIPLVHRESHREAA